jgi:hypothetical protein
MCADGGVMIVPIDHKPNQAEKAQIGDKPEIVLG